MEATEKQKEAEAVVAAAEDAAEKDRAALQQKHAQEAAEVAAKVEAAERRKSELAAPAQTDADPSSAPMQKPALLSAEVLGGVMQALKEVTLARTAANVATQAVTAAAIPGSRLLMFPDMGHNLPEPRQDEMVAAIVRNTLRSSVGDGV